MRDPKNNAYTVGAPDTTRDTVVVMVLDETTSMSSIASETVDGVNAFFHALRTNANPNKVMVGCWSFSAHTNEPVMRRVAPISSLLDWKPIERSAYRPRGFTPLYDAVAHGIGYAEDMAAQTLAIKGERAKVIVVIQTDGDENQSREITLSALQRMISRRKEDGWEFVFLGADLGAARQISERIGTQMANTMAYDSRMTADLYAVTGANAASFAKGEKRNMAFTEEERARFRSGLDKT